MGNAPSWTSIGCNTFLEGNYWGLCVWSLDNGYQTVAVAENKLASVKGKWLNGGDSALGWLIY